MSDRRNILSAHPVIVPVVYFPDGRPAPLVMTEAEVISIVRLDEAGGESPSETLAYYRKKGLLRATQIGRMNRYSLFEVIAFLERQTEANPK